MWLLAWFAFVVVFVAAPLLLAWWRSRRTIDATGRLPDPRGPQRPAPDVVEAEQLAIARLRLAAAVGAVAALISLFVGLAF